MALVLADRVRETTTVVGTGTATLLGAVTGYQSFTAVGNANTTYYVIASQAADEWEVGIGTYTASGTTLSRDTVLSSSNSNSLVNFTAGTKDIWVDYAAGKAVTTDTLSSPPVIGNTTPNAATFTTLTATGDSNLNGNVLLGNGSNNYWRAQGSSSIINISGQGTTANINQYIISKGTGSTWFSTGSLGGNAQMAVSHTASAVNFVQVTGAATGGSPVISAQGSDTNIPLTLNSKGNNGIIFQTRGAGTPRVALQLLDSGSASVNYLQIQSNISGAGPVLSALGTDTNISQVFQSKGTGAIDLAAGSSGVNISNGGTVTAITATVSGTGYTSIPSVAVSAPTTAGGVQATASALMFTSTATVQSGGTGYTNGDVLTIVGGTTGGAVGTYTVTGVSGGVITSVSRTTGSGYSVRPSNPVSTTGGTGSGATLNLTWTVSGFTITNAGSGYVEQPTVTFSGGGGSGAAAYATVGSTPRLTSIGSSLEFASANGIGFRVANSGTANINYYSAQGNFSGGSVLLTATGADTDISSAISSKGAGNVRFQTNNSAQEQLRVAHTASAVNYVQVTGAATGNGPTISAQGSDANSTLAISSKGTGAIRFDTGGATAQFRVLNTASAVNRIDVTGSAAGSAPSFTCSGSDTNIDLALTPKGTGNVRFGTYTGTALSIAGYIEIKTADGTIRKLAVVA